MKSRNRPTSSGPVYLSAYGGAPGSVKSSLCPNSFCWISGPLQPCLHCGSSGRENMCCGSMSASTHAPARARHVWAHPHQAGVPADPGPDRQPVPAEVGTAAGTDHRPAWLSEPAIADAGHTDQYASARRPNRAQAAQPGRDRVRPLLTGPRRDFQGVGHLPHVAQ